jgi:hypothetical protein
MDELLQERKKDTKLNKWVFTKIHCISGNFRLRLFFLDNTWWNPTLVGLFLDFEQCSRGGWNKIYQA